MRGEKTEKKEKGDRLGVPPVGEAYQQMQGNNKAEDTLEKRERRKEEKENQHLGQEKTRGYEKHLPPVEGKINIERPPFKKK